MDKKNLSLHLDLILVLIIYSALAIFSISYHHYRLGADGISYVSIAAKYVNGDWPNAINAYWSPLYSWLITPIIFLIGQNPDYASYVTRIVSLIVGFFTIIGMSKLSSTFNFKKPVKKILLVTLIPMILFYSIFYDTPDALVLCLLVYYFSFIFNENYSNHWFNGAICGLCGGLGFLSKTYIFPFFIIHFVFFNFLYYYGNIKDFNIKKNGIKKNCILGFVVFFAISSIWIGTLSLHYDKLTIGTTTEYNHAITGPEYPTHPVYFMGLIKPPNTSATSTWEEPSLVNLDGWSPFESWEYFSYQLRLFSENLFKFIIFLKYYSIFSIIIIIISLFYLVRSGMEISFKRKLAYIFITIFIYLSGYLLIHVQDRYIWPVFILLMFCGFYMGNYLYQKNPCSKLINVFLAILMFSFIFIPVSELFLYPNQDDNFYSLSKTLKNNYEINGNIASNDLWEKSNKISFYLNSQYYGLPKNDIYSSELENELKTNNINYYFVWGNNSSNVHLTVYKEITGGKIPDLKIYERKSNSFET